MGILEFFLRDTDCFRSTLLQRLGVSVPLEGEHGDAGAIDALYAEGAALDLDGVTGFGGTA